MKVQKMDSRTERRILAGMILHTEVLGRIALRWTDGMFRSAWASMVGTWAVQHFKRYAKAPGKEIQTKFDRWAKRSSDTKRIELVERFLAYLSRESESESLNVEYLLDLAGEYFNTVQLEQLSEQLADDLLEGRTEEAQSRVQNFSRVEIGLGTGITLHDHAAIQAAFDEKHESILSYPGALGQFFGPYMERDGFVAFMAPEKRGKSFWLMDAVYRGLVQRRKVAWFEVGDMSQAQALRRLASRIAKHPIRAGIVAYPKEISRPENAEPNIIPEVISEEKEFQYGLTYAKAVQAIDRFTKRKGGDGLKFASYPNSSISVSGIREVLGVWEREGWVPDLIVIDYADILDHASNGVSDFRHQTNATWQGLRRLSQELHCLVLTATQTDAASYDARTLQRKHFSEDKRKYSHVTGIVGINQTSEERTHGIQRLNWVLRRDGEYSEMATVCVAGALGIGNPAVRSCW